MTINEIKNRWKTTEGELKLKSIIKCLKNNTSLEKYADKIDQKWDLRGVKFSKPEIKKYTLLNYSIEENENVLEFKDAIFKDFDFSFSDLSYMSFIKCEFENIKMFDTKANYMKLWACSMKTATIEKTDFQHSLLGGRLAGNSGFFTDVRFIDSNFKETVYSYPLFKNCVFEKCNLDEVHFDGSRFEDSAFIGRLYSTIFRGVTTHFGRQTLFERKIDPNDFPNLMKNVDFTNAELNAVSFVNGVDLSTCKLPSSGDYLLIGDLESVYTEAKATIGSEWVGEDRRIALQIIDLAYYTKHHKNQKQDIVDKQSLIDQLGFDFAKKFYELIEKINNKINRIT